MKNKVKKAVGGSTFYVGVVFMVVSMCTVFLVHNVSAETSNGDDGVVTSGSTDTSGVIGSSSNGDGVIQGSNTNSGSVTGGSSNGDGITTTGNTGVTVGGGSSNGDDGGSVSVGTVGTVTGGSSNGDGVTVGVTTGGSSNGDGDVSVPPSNPVTPPSVNVGGGGGSYGMFVDVGTFYGSSTPTLPSICISINSYVRLGANNNPVEVLKIQNFLRTYEGANIELTGIYDIPTFEAVMAFQQKYAADILAPWGSNTPSGYVYITTEKKMNEISCRIFRSLTPDEATIIAAYRSAVAGGGSTTVGFIPTAPGTTPRVTTPTTTPGQLLPVIGQNNKNTPAGNQIGTANIFSTVFGAIGRFFGGLFGGK